MISYTPEEAELIESERLQTKYKNNITISLRLQFIMYVSSYSYILFVSAPDLISSASSGVYEIICS